MSARNKKYLSDNRRGALPAQFDVVSNTNITIPKNFIGLHHGANASQPNLAGFKYGLWRTHDSGFRWYSIETSYGFYNWDAFETEVNYEVARGNEVMFTLYSPPIFHITGPIAQRWTANTVHPGTTNDATYKYPTIANRNGRRYHGTAGTTGATEPTWPTTNGATVVDGSVTWTCFYYQGSPYGGINDGAPAGAFNQVPSTQSVYNFITALLTRFNSGGNHKIKYIEIMNEADYLKTSAGWFVGDPPDLVAIANEARTAITNFGDATVKLCCGGWTGNGSQLTSFLNAQDTISGKFGHQVAFDYITYHNYGGHSRYDSNVSGVVRLNNFLHKTTNGLNAYINALTPFSLQNTPIMVSEFGRYSNANNLGGSTYSFNTMPDEDAKNLMLITLLYHVAIGIKNIIIYNYESSQFTGDLQNPTGKRAAFDTFAGFGVLNWLKINKVDDSVYCSIDGKEYVFKYPETTGNSW